MIKKNLVVAVIGAILMLNDGHCTSSATTRHPPLKYPEAPRSETVDDYHGTKVADPFRPLEDPDSPATRAWVEAENKVTFGFLDSIPERASIRQRLTELWNYEKYGAPHQEGGRYFYTCNTGLQNQNVLYTTDSLDGQPQGLAGPQHACRPTAPWPCLARRQPRWQAAGLRDRRGRLGLERVEGPRRGHR